MATRGNLQKFKQNKPLKKYVNNNYSDKCLIHYNKFEPSEYFELIDATWAKKLDIASLGEIIFGIRASEEELEKYDFLWCPDGPAFVVHARVLEKFNEICPNDIQPIPIVIKNLETQNTCFENKSFYLLNILHIVDIIDHEKSESYYRGDFLEFRKKMYFKDVSYMQGHLIAMIKESEPEIILHPSLAKHFKNSKGIQFLTDEEAPI